MAWQARSIDGSRTDSLKQEDGLDIWLAKRPPWLRTEDTYRQNPRNNRSSRLPVCSRILSACQWSLGGLISLDLLCLWCAWAKELWVKWTHVSSMLEHVMSGVRPFKILVPFGGIWQGLKYYFPVSLRPGARGFGAALLGQPPLNSGGWAGGKLS